jgi:hypothetical protein
MGISLHPDGCNWLKPSMRVIYFSTNGLRDWSACSAPSKHQGAVPANPPVCPFFVGVAEAVFYNTHTENFLLRNSLQLSLVLMIA